MKIIKLKPLFPSVGLHDFPNHDGSGVFECAIGETVHGKTCTLNQAFTCQDLLVQAFHQVRMAVSA